MLCARLVLVALIAAAASPVALAQWKWRDKSGVVQYSDLPPPQGTPDKDILERPAVQRSFFAAHSASAPASPPAAAASAAKVDPELEARRKKLEQERGAKDAAARKAEEERVAAVKADNCSRAKSALRSLEDGVRMARTNDKGEREVLDDKARADEAARMRSIIASDCAK